MLRGWHKITPEMIEAIPARDRTRKVDLALVKAAYQYHYQDNFTVIIVKSGTQFTVGVAKKRTNETYNIRIGQQVAWVEAYRAYATRL